MFIDSVELTVSSGKGGAGAVSFHREKFVPKGGPDGGDGGRGGDVYFRVDKNTHTLSHFKGKRSLAAQNGQDGSGRNKTGKAGEDLVLIVPPGTQVLDKQSGRLLYDLTEDGQTIKLLEGGKGGLGNARFKSSTNQRPTYAQPGLPGESLQIRLELKLIADVGLVGFPNVGKSTLIATISSAKPEIADYEFTTITPKLGVVEAGEFRSFVMADIPGIIGGASEGRGLGLKFLKHIERTKTLLFMIDLAGYRECAQQYETLRQELERFSAQLSKRAYAIALTRVDAMNPEEAARKIKLFLDSLGLDESSLSKYGFDRGWPFYCQEISKFDPLKPFFVLPISSVSGLNVKPLVFALFDLVSKER